MRSGSVHGTMTGTARATWAAIRAIGRNLVRYVEERGGCVHAIEEVASGFGLGPEDWEPMGWDAGKLTYAALERAGVLGDPPGDGFGPGRLVLVTAMTPTPAGEGKTTTSIGLADGLRRLGTKSVACLREPSLGPSLGLKGGGTGGGRATIEPSDRVNLHFTGDLHAITAANNLLAAVVDNALHFRTSGLDLDPRDVSFFRALDMDDRALRNIVIGLGGHSGGVPRETGFVITAASEVMAILALSSGLEDLRSRLARIVVGWDRKRKPVTAQDLGAHEAMAALLADAIRPNLVRTAEGTPALVHAGPFANIAHGTSSILATRFALTRSEVVVTEAGFGSDLGAEKFVDLVAPVGGFAPEAVVLVVTVRALAYHGGLDPSSSGADPDPGGVLRAVKRGLANLDAHLGIVGSFGVPVVVAINRFTHDTDEEIAEVMAHVRGRGIPAAVSEAFARGAEGGEALARSVLEALGPRTAGRRRLDRFYPPGAGIQEAVDALARRVYGAQGTEWSPAALQTLRRLERSGFGALPVCVAKTQASLTDDPHVRNVAEGPWSLSVRELRLSAGAGFAVAVTGDILTMPGLPRDPQALRIRVLPDGVIEGIR